MDPSRDTGPQRSAGTGSFSWTLLDDLMNGRGVRLVDLPLLSMMAALITALVVILICFVIALIVRKCRAGASQSSDKSDVITNEEDITDSGDSRPSVIDVNEKKAESVLPVFSAPKRNSSVKFDPDESEMTISRSDSQSLCCISDTGQDLGSGLVNLAYQQGNDAGDPEELDTAGVPPCKYGRLWFTVVYNEVSRKLFIRVIKAKYLKPRDRSNTLRDPFVKVYLLPDEANRQESKIVENTLAPHFDQTFEFTNERSDLIKFKTVRLSVYDVDKRRVRHSLGHVIFPLCGYDVASGVVIWRDLESDESLSSWHSMGEVSLALRQDLQSESLQVSVVAARNLRKQDFMDKGHSVQVQLFLGDKVLREMRTTTKPFRDEVQYDSEVFIFSLPFNQLTACSLVVSILVETSSMDSDNSDTERHQEEEYGRVVLGGMERGQYGDEGMHWEAVGLRCGETITRWHALKSPAIQAGL
jgi:hypothetical protein